MHLDELGQTFVIRLWCKDRHKMHYPSRRAIYECLPKFVQTHNASSSIKTANVIGYQVITFCQP